MINIQKSHAPAHAIKYNDKVIENQIRNDFFVLCYICEEYAPIHFQIDHFYPKGQPEFVHLTHNWDNLFYCCAKCNGIRPKDINTMGNEVLNNCIDEVEKFIYLKYESGRINVIANSHDNKTKNTEKLLNRVYNGIGSNNSRSYIYRREEIKKEIEKFQRIVEKYLKNNELFENELKERLSKKTKTETSAYVSFKRQIVRENYKEFEKYFD